MPTSVSTPNKVITPRCPVCNKLQANSVVEGDFTCRGCRTRFLIGDGYITILTKDLTGKTK